MRRIVVAEHIQEDLFGCHRWQMRKNRDGYGTVGKDLAHRRVLLDRGVPIPKGMWVDHLCNVRDCVNPDHLEVVTPRVNTLRSEFTIAGINARKSHCIRGHEFTDSNTYLTKQGWRECRTCINDRKRSAYARKHGTQSNLARRQPTNRPPTKPRGR